ncbi:hypothetical protein [Massilia antarctica]|uniref:hypothetical protein n=1 Tax=Massilia antarctica TaxID=2765360 RepID=UPI0006BDE35D|nr:hypothetical protein [Massilia sp. H27-R4]MCY0912857.1 hypothetical protein [Massilia sp. H27-R4]CUI07431.1 hypothetical protein BN2497_9639 [Janthinobacterium sp. CG23_2]CUU31217.1 hypothetical protein BN3177_9639 [Janthinobacterium sp. CG23_2]
MDRTTLARLVGDLRGDAQLFHTFLADPAAALGSLAYLDEATRRAIAAIDPQAFIADAAALQDRAVALGECSGDTCFITCYATCRVNTRGTGCGETVNLRAGAAARVPPAPNPGGTPFARLVGDLRDDEQLFDTFIADPDAAMRTLPYLDSIGGGTPRALNPRRVGSSGAGLARADLVLGACGPQYTCSCTSYTCAGVTCGGSTCDVTCTDTSCGNTCGDSCGFTTNIDARYLGLDLWRNERARAAYLVRK